MSPMAAARMKPPDYPPESRAPPPSPVAGREATIDDGDELVRFITRSVRIPELVLPNGILHRVAWNLPEIYLPILAAPAAEILRSVAVAPGCFQVVEHGISSDVIAAAGAAATAVFGMAAEKKRAAARTAERRWGFEREEEEQEEEGGEEIFWWCAGWKGDLAGIWPFGFKDFSDKIDLLWVEMEKIAGMVEHVLLPENDGQDSEARRRRGGDGSVLCLHKHGRSNTNTGGAAPAGVLKHDVLRMLIRSSKCSHALGIHICGGASRFNVYSKKGYTTFRIKEGAVVVTMGDKIQAWTGGRYKNATGKPVFHDEDHEDAISMAFFYSPSSPTEDSSIIDVIDEKHISLYGQIMITTCLVLLYHIIVYIYAHL